MGWGDGRGGAGVLEIIEYGWPADEKQKSHLHRDHSPLGWTAVWVLVIPSLAGSARVGHCESCSM